MSSWSEWKCQSHHKFKKKKEYIFLFILFLHLSFFCSILMTMRMCQKKKEALKQKEYFCRFPFMRKKMFAIYINIYLSLFFCVCIFRCFNNSWVFILQEIKEMEKWLYERKSLIVPVFLKRKSEPKALHTRAPQKYKGNERKSYSAFISSFHSYK